MMCSSDLCSNLHRAQLIGSSNLLPRTLFTGVKNNNLWSIWQRSNRFLSTNSSARSCPTSNRKTLLSSKTAQSSFLGLSYDWETGVCGVKFSITRESYTTKKQIHFCRPECAQLNESFCVAAEGTGDFVTARPIASRFCPVSAISPPTRCLIVSANYCCNRWRPIRSDGSATKGPRNSAACEMLSCNNWSKMTWPAIFAGISCWRPSANLSRVRIQPHGHVNKAARRLTTDPNCFVADRPHRSQQEKRAHPS
jgi:hypothetical protein